MKKKTNIFLKRTIDIFFSLSGIIILLPVFLIISIVIKLDNKGPILFKQERLGYHGTKFKIYKFRTMIVNAENIGDGVYINEKNDKRITRIGSFLRKTSLDELPQLFNVLKGEMSLVGPRPPVTYHPYDGYENYPEWAKKRFEMKPGMTGLVQIKCSIDESWDDRIRVDNEYVSNFSIIYDFLIIFMTIKVIFKPNKF